MTLQRSMAGLRATLALDEIPTSGGVLKHGTGGAIRLIAVTGTGDERSGPQLTIVCTAVSMGPRHPARQPCSQPTGTLQPTVPGLEAPLQRRKRVDVSGAQHDRYSHGAREQRAGMCTATSLSVCCAASLRTE